MIGVAVSCGATATVCYLWGRSIKGRADYFNSTTRVINLKWLDDMVKEKTTNLLVVVSGKVGSAAPFNCKGNGHLGAVFEDKVEMVYETKLEDGGLIKKSINILLQHKKTPWYLEDSTGRVNVVGANHYDETFDNNMEGAYIVKPLNEFFNKLFSPEEGSQVLFRHALNIGTPLTFVGEAVRDKASNLMIQDSKEQSLMVFPDEDSFDKMVDNMKSNSEFYLLFSKIFGTIAVAIAVKYGVDYIKKKKYGVDLMRRFLLPFVWKKKDLGNNRSENEQSDSD